MFIDKNRTFIIAEIGNNHEGDFELAKKMISLASEAGADAVKFQTINPELLVSIEQKDRLKKLKLFQFSQKQFEELSDYSKDCNVVFFSTPFDIKSAIFLNKIQPIFKISSGDNSFYPLIDKVIGFGKPTIISTGFFNSDQIDYLYNSIISSWENKKINSEFYFTHCVSSYPVPDDQANISLIPNLIEKYPKAIIGYSDHTIGIEACLLAVSLGAKLIEKHFTIDNDFSNFRDHQLSSNPNEFQSLVKSIRRIELMKGTGEFKLQPCEKLNIKSTKRSIAANKDLKAGGIILKEDITWLRPGDGFKIGEENLILGRLIKKPIKKGEIIKQDKLEKLNI